MSSSPLSEDGPANPDANMDNQIQPPLVLEPSEHYPYLSWKALYADPTLHAVLMVFSVFCLNSLIAAPALLATVLLPLLVSFSLPCNPVLVCVITDFAI